CAKERTVTRSFDSW
nr:immunoglobulin heavy chain junction region [Macaca mulatta]MOV48971.1 immunoglobulin heavy chain junction region [Macaca mulatta]MOV49146.1 immunoglobulin heavy chain junction region [Macaca mulatta]MOV49300.1 immunoglobulin heavy chain junction region [Macaca mulatta]MOV49312.1 immunoglobulin heavy chain junction region [Macaca mulatta]